ncbi:RHS repeat-associated core domain-containing protein [Nitratidesulfovibrio termitidis]|uniref:RHS repeat-associated core domain-containing protein n=1 Tax=Nitratidesulfovibrio termitidis TaxID=42252 RepID=UPI0018DBB76E|nr:RHS repeat-associated core domain-containing protein [Nitratidesulfovibrio termitidis]
MQCAFSPDGRLRAKQERCGGRAASYDYTHDERGHLTEVRRDGQGAERYTYNTAGQRITARVNPLPGMSRDALRLMETERAFAYDNTGRLVRAGRARYMYAPDGTLRCREEGRSSTWFYYANGGNAAGGAPSASPDPYRPHAPHHPHHPHDLHDQLAPVALDSVVLPGGDIIRYRFGDNGMPFMVLRNHAPSEEYQWLDPLRLARFRDHRTGSDYTFHYGGDRVPEAVTVCGPALDNLDGNLLDLSIFRKDGEAAPPPRSVTFRIGRDQVGTVKVLMDPDGKVVKRMEYDSFGNPLLDTCPYFFLPLGFAGGLTDRHTGLVRFGFRDYDPRTGRFTAPDPLGDTGGDHDPYDYCVDDPVSAFDPLGLIGEAIIGQGWDESKHPRNPDGTFTFSHGGGAMTLEHRQPVLPLPEGSLTHPPRVRPGIYPGEVILKPFGPRRGDELILGLPTGRSGQQLLNDEQPPDSRLYPEQRPRPSEGYTPPLGRGGSGRAEIRTLPHYNDGRSPYAENLLMASNDSGQPTPSPQTAPEKIGQKKYDLLKDRIKQNHLESDPIGHLYATLTFLEGSLESGNWENPTPSFSTGNSSLAFGLGVDSQHMTHADIAEYKRRINSPDGDTSSRMLAQFAQLNRGQAQKALERYVVETGTYPRLTGEQAYTLSRIAIEKRQDATRQRFDKETPSADEGGSFDNLPIQAQTVLSSGAYQYGVGGMASGKLKPVWDAIKAHDWGSASHALRTCNDGFSSRRHVEAKLLDEIPRAGQKK